MTPLTIDPGEPVPAPETAEGSSVEAAYELLIAALRNQTDAELDAVYAPYDIRVLRKTELSVAHTDLWKRYYARRAEIAEDLGFPGGDHDLTAEDQVRMNTALTESGDDLFAAYCRQLRAVQRERIAALVVFTASAASSECILEAMLALFRRAAATGEVLLARQLPYPVMRQIAMLDRDPYVPWQIAMDSGMPDVISDLFIELDRFPAERVEPLLVLGLRDPRWLVRFGAMEATRFLGAESKLANPQQLAVELLHAALEYAEEPGRCVLMLEAIAAIGQADPLLLEQVNGETQPWLRGLAATNYVLGVDEDVALAQVHRWLADVDLFETGLHALAVLGGGPADALLLETLADQSLSAEGRANILAAMAGRGPQFAQAFVDALHDPAPGMRDAGLAGLMALTLDDQLDAGTRRLVLESMSQAAESAPDAVQRRDALVGLALMGGEQASRAIKERFLAEQDAEVRGQAGGLLLLKAGGDPQLRAWIKERVSAESTPVRMALEDLQNRLEDPERRKAWRASLEEESDVWTLVDQLSQAPSGKDPIGQTTAFHQALLDALDAWDSADPGPEEAPDDPGNP